MKKEHKLSLQITASVSIFSILFGVIFLFLFSDINSFQEFFISLSTSEQFFGADIGYMYLYIFLKAIGITFGIYLICWYFTKKIYAPIESYNKKLTDYNHYLAHELKTPLTVIHSYLDILKHGGGKDVIRKSQEEIQSVTQVIDKLLYMAESLRLSEKKDINVEQFFQSYFTTLSLDLRQMIELENVQFNLHIYTDPTLFQRVISNIIENAWKYASEKKLLIKIDATKISFSNPVEQKISSKQIQELQNTFYTTAKEGDSGYGIGLSLISEIVDLLGYRLEISCTEEVFSVIIYLQK